jgi:hypothetical protein
MTQTIAPASSVVRRAPSGPPAGSSRRSKRRRPARARGNPPHQKAGVGVGARRRLSRLGSYTDASGRTREVIAVRRGDGDVLVVDRDAVTLGDYRLVAHLAADEPSENAALVCDYYLCDEHRGRCRRVNAEDLTGRPSVEEESSPGPVSGNPRRAELVGRRGEERDYAYRLEPVRTERSGVELRWRRHSRRAGPAAPTPVCVRDVIGALESYEPVCGLTLRAVAIYRDDPQISTAVLRGELARVRESPIVLNRKLRQAVLSAVEHRGLSMSEIAYRCGRVKRGCKGGACGETSWLARRVGVMPESGTDRLGPWVHSDVLALIARDGLGISPREVELG